MLEHNGAAKQHHIINQVCAARDRPGLSCKFEYLLGSLLNSVFSDQYNVNYSKQ